MVSKRRVVFLEGSVHFHVSWWEGSQSGLPYSEWDLYRPDVEGGCGRMQWDVLALCRCIALGIQAAGSYLGSPVAPFYPFLGEGSPTKIDYNKRVPLFNLSTGGPRCAFEVIYVYR